MPQKLTTTACFIQEESSGGKPPEDSTWELPPEDSSWIYHLKGLPPEDSSWMKQAVVVSF